MPTAIEKLLATPPKKLFADLERVRDRERLLAQERELLERVLEILAENAMSADREEDADLLVTVGPLRRQIGRVLERGEPGKAWFPRDVQRELAAHGNTKASLDNVRMTMKRMAAAGELVKPVRGKLSYALPAGED